MFDRDNLTFDAPCNVTSEKQAELDSPVYYVGAWPAIPSLISFDFITCNEAINGSKKQEADIEEEGKEQELQYSED